MEETLHGELAAHYLQLYLFLVTCTVCACGMCVTASLLNCSIVCVYFQC